MMEAIVGIYHLPRPEPGPRLQLQLEGGGLTVMGIESYLGQVFRNLIDNAISFSPEDGVINISVKRRHDQVVIEVEDDGPGIDEDKLTKVFERFYSERPESEPFGTHSGLGLNICRQIISAHDGKIHAENRYRLQGPDGPTLGARFVVALPAVVARQRSSGSNR